MSNACPLNFKKVDATISRFSAFIVAILVVLYLFTSNIFLLYFLAIDFVVKLFVDKKLSPIFFISKSLKNILRMQERLSDGGAKRLAGFFGLFFVVLLIVMHFIVPWEISLGVAVIFLFCSLLDVFFDYCIGCKIYFIIKKIYPNFMNRL